MRSILSVVVNSASAWQFSLRQPTLHLLHHPCYELKFGSVREPESCCPVKSSELSSVVVDVKDLCIRAKPFGGKVVAVQVNSLENSGLLSVIDGGAIAFSTRTLRQASELLLALQPPESLSYLLTLPAHLRDLVGSSSVPATFPNYHRYG